MKGESTIELVERLKEASEIISEVVSTLKTLKPELTVAEMVKCIVEKISLKKTAQRLDVDSTTVCRWRREKGIKKNNRLKVEALYKELFG